MGDGQYDLDLTTPRVTLDRPTADTLDNYLLIARSKDLGVHHPVYEKRLLSDAITQITGGAPAFSPIRPS